MECIRLLEFAERGEVKAAKTGEEYFGEDEIELDAEEEYRSWGWEEND